LLTLILVSLQYYDRAIMGNSSDAEGKRGIITEAWLRTHLAWASSLVVLAFGAGAIHYEIKNEMAGLRRDVDGNAVIERARHVFDDNGFVDPAMRAAVEFSVRKLGGKLFYSRDDDDAADEKRWDALFEANPQLKRPKVTR
jgi:hypothetical protein